MVTTAKAVRKVSASEGSSTIVTTRILREIKFGLATRQQRHGRNFGRIQGVDVSILPRFSLTQYLVEPVDRPTIFSTQEQRGPHLPFSTSESDIFGFLISWALNIRLQFRDSVRKDQRLKKSSIAKLSNLHMMQKIGLNQEDRAHFSLSLIWVNRRR